jgi:hypothetical protein
MTAEFEIGEKTLGIDCNLNKLRALPEYEV